MGFVLLIRDEAGNVTYLSKLFSSEAECFEFVKSHSINDYEIVTQSEFESYLQQSQQKQQGYRQTVDVDIIDEEEPQRPSRPIIRNYSPRFIRPVFVGSNKKDRREKNGF
jgi:hypothetical protein